MLNMVLCWWCFSWEWVEKKRNMESKCVNLNLLCCYGGFSPTMLWERSLQNPLVVFIRTWTAWQPREKEVETVASRSRFSATQCDQAGCLACQIIQVEILSICPSPATTSTSPLRNWEALHRVGWWDLKLWTRRMGIFGKVSYNVEKITRIFMASEEYKLHIYPHVVARRWSNSRSANMWCNVRAWYDFFGGLH
jgi:hypothetical protein